MDRAFPVPFLSVGSVKKKTLKREEKRNKVFSAFKLSFDSLPNETGLLYVHLNPTEHLKKTLRLFDAKAAIICSISMSWSSSCRERPS